MQQAYSCGQIQLNSATPYCVGTSLAVCRCNMQCPYISFGFKRTNTCLFENQALQITAEKGHTIWLLTLGKQCVRGIPVVLCVTPHTRILFGWLPNHPQDKSTCSNWLVLAELSHSNVTSFPGVAELCHLPRVPVTGHSQHSSRLFLGEGHLLTLGFFFLLASPSLSSSQWLMSFLCLERKLVRA